MKFIVINDTHAGIRNSSDTFADNEQRFYTDILFPYMKENGIKRILHLGDVFDNRKFINFKSLHRYRKMFLSKLREYGMHMDVILGNHDTYYKNTNDLNSLKELLGHYMNEVTIHIDPTVINYDGFKIALLPWICPENYDRSLAFIKTCSADWLAGHLELMGFDVMKGVQSHAGLHHETFSRFEKVISGHFHTRSQKDNIYYLGSQLEFYWSDAGDQKYFHVINTETRELTPVPIPYKIFHKIVYDDSLHDYMKYDFSQCDHRFVKIVVVNKSDLFTFDSFVDKIQARPIYELKIAENFNEFVGENIEDEGIQLDDTEILLDSYVDAVETDLDKPRLKNSMRSLLIEAQALEFV
jgi:DNA repair exonuclease SbcCD nuclease subunit